MWFKVDDKFPEHRKCRHVRRSDPAKRRDVAPIGLWALAGAWSDDGFVPLEVLQDWDDDAEELAGRLVAAGLWVECTQDGEPGYRFHDWTQMNPNASERGAEGNHLRWHVARGVVADGCAFCHPDDRPRIGGESGGESPRWKPAQNGLLDARRRRRNRARTDTRQLPATPLARSGLSGAIRGRYRHPIGGESSRPDPTRPFKSWHASSS